MNRQELQHEALQNVCPCFYYDMADTIDEMPDDLLHRIVDIGWWAHVEQELQQPVDIDEFYDLLADCPDFIHDIGVLTEAKKEKVI